jgi:hypothetical protein
VGRPEGGQNADHVDGQVEGEDERRKGEEAFPDVTFRRWTARWLGWVVERRGEKTKREEKEEITQKTRKTCRRRVLASAEAFWGLFISERAFVDTRER